MTVAGGIPTLSLNNGGIATYTGGSGHQRTDLQLHGWRRAEHRRPGGGPFNLNGATVKDAAGNSANLAGAATNPAGTLQIDTTAPTVPSVVASGSGIDGSGTAISMPAMW